MLGSYFQVRHNYSKVEEERFRRTGEVFSIVDFVASGQWEHDKLHLLLDPSVPARESLVERTVSDAIVYKSLGQPAAGHAAALPETLVGKAAPVEWLFRWDQILPALKRKGEDERRRIARLNENFKGPIIPAGKQGGQPMVDKAKLLTWWNALADRVSVQEATSQARLERATAPPGDRLYDGKIPFGQVKTDQRTTGRQSRGK